MFRQVNTRHRPFRSANTSRERGAIAVFAAVVMTVAAAAAGAAIDFGRIYTLKYRLQVAADSAALAANAYTQTRTQEALAPIAQTYVDQDAALKRLGTITVEKKLYNETNLTFEVVLRGDIKTGLLQLLGIKTLTARAKAISYRKAGPMELVLALDATGSMNGPFSAAAGGNKRAALRSAVNSFLDVIKAPVVSVAVVPFAEYVKVTPSDIRSPFSTDTGLLTCGNPLPARPYSAWVNTQDWIDRDELRKMATCTLQTFNGCMTNRIVPDQRMSLADKFEPGTEAVTAEAMSTITDITTSDANRFPAASNLVCGYAVSTNDPTGGAVMDLKKTDTNLDLIKRKVNGLGSIGNSYLPSGLLWSWMVLTNDAPFTTAVTKASAAETGLRKVILIVSDGGNNFRARSDGSVSTGGNPPATAGVRPDGSDVSEYWDVDKLQEQICTNIKNDGIEIYTIAFGEPGVTGGEASLRTVMRNCATSPETYFNGETPDRVTQAFKDLGGALKPLRLSE